MHTTDVVLAAVGLVVGYLVGGIPFGVLVSRIVGGPDPRTLGSGRTGGANVARSLGPRWALVSGLLDVAKASVAVLIVRFLGAGDAIQILTALAAIVGHSRSPYIGLKGGRGVSPGIGGVLVIQPLVAAAIVPIFLIILFVGRYSSLASLSASAFGGLVMLVLVAVEPLPIVFVAYAIAAPALIWYFHRDNIQRLMAGQERRFGNRA